MLKHFVFGLLKFYLLILFAAANNATNALDCVDARLRAGKCITLKQCPHLVEEFYKEASKISYAIDFQTFVSSSICGFDSSDFLVCCATNTNTNSKENTPTKNPIAEPNQSTPFVFASLKGYMPQTQAPLNINNNIMPLVFYPTYAASYTNTIPATTVQTPPTEVAEVTSYIPFQAVTTQSSLITQIAHQPINIPTCGINRGSINRVVGGSEAKRGNYPWIAALGYHDVNYPSILKFLCAGSLISPKYVLTSAHCINNQLTVVRLGAHDLANTAEKDAKNYHIKRIVIHDKFELKTITNDLALIELSEPVIMTKYINIICLPEDDSFLTQDFEGMHPFVAGWGAKQNKGPTSNVLRDVQIPIVNRQECEQSYRTIFKFVKISEMLICAGNSAADACQGDSGGPLMLPQLSGTTFQYHILGVVSYGYECARTGFPGVYTKVAAYLPWIQSNMT